MIPLRLDTVIMLLSAGLLLYGGWLSIPSPSVRDAAVSTAQDDPASYLQDLQPTFPYERMAVSVKQTIDSRVARSLLVLGTACTIVTAIIATFLWPVPTPWGIATSAYLFAFVLAIATAHATRLLWHCRGEAREIAHRFFEWLEVETGNPGFKGYQLELVVPNIAGGSGFPPLVEFMRHDGQDDDTVSRWIAKTARGHRYSWQREDFQAWAEDILRTDAPNAALSTITTLSTSSDAQEIANASESQRPDV